MMGMLELRTISLLKLERNNGILILLLKVERNKKKKKEKIAWHNGTVKTYC